MQEPVEGGSHAQTAEEQAIEEPSHELVNEIVDQDEEHREQAYEEPVEPESFTAEQSEELIRHESVEAEELPTRTSGEIPNEIDEEQPPEKEQVNAPEDLEEIPHAQAIEQPQEQPVQEEPAWETTADQTDGTAAEEPEEEYEQPSADNVETTINVPRSDDIEEPSKKDISSEIEQDEIGDQTEETAEVQTLELAHETAETHETLAPGEPSEDVPITEILDEQPTVDPTNEAPPEEHAQDDEIPKPPVDEPAIDGESTAQSSEREVNYESQEQSEVEQPKEGPSTVFVTTDAVADDAEFDVESASLENDVQNETDEITPVVTAPFTTAPAEEESDSGDKEEPIEQGDPVDVLDEHLVDQNPPDEEESPHEKTKNVDTTLSLESPPKDVPTNDDVADVPAHTVDIEETSTADQLMEDIVLDTSAPKPGETEMVSEESVKEVEYDEATIEEVPATEVSRQSAMANAVESDDVPAEETYMKEDSTEEAHASDNTEEHDIMPEVALVAGGIGLAVVAVAQSHEDDDSKVKESTLEDDQEEFVPEFLHEELDPETTVDSEKEQDEPYETPNIDEKIADEPQISKPDQEQTTEAPETPELVMSDVLTGPEIVTEEESLEIKGEGSDSHRETVDVQQEAFSVESIEQEQDSGNGN